MTWLGKDFYLSINFAGYSHIFVFITIFKIMCLYAFLLYTKPKYKSDFITVIYIFKAATVSMMGMVLIAYFLGADVIPRVVILLSWLYSTIFMSTWRISAKAAVQSFIDRDFFKSQLLIIGADANAEKIAIRLLNDASINYKLVGFIGCHADTFRKEISKFPVLGPIDDISEILKKYTVDEVALTSRCLSDQELSRIFAAFQHRKGAIFRVTSDLYDGMVSYCSLRERSISFVPLISSYSTPIWYLPVKRILDIIISLLLLIITSPIMILTALIIKLTSPGPIFYITKRVGQGGSIFVMYKFRTMRERHSRTRIERWAKKSDERITPIGGVLRRFRLDELPQLINVLKNEMSLIGPRPESRYYVSHLLKETPMYSERFKTLPGITGWAQVNFGYAASVEESKEKLLYDIYYIQNQSLALDTLIALKTIKTVITGKGVR